MSTDERIVIEPATIDDVEAVADCWVALAAEQRQHGSRLAADANRTVATETIAHHVVTDGLLVARDGAIQGFVMFHPDDGAYTQTESTGTITHLYVRPAARDEGIGSRLLAAAESKLAAAGVSTVAIEVLADNAAAKRLYDRRGYDPHRIELRKRLENDRHSKDDG